MPKPQMWPQRHLWPPRLSPWSGCTCGLPAWWADGSFLPGRGLRLAQDWEAGWFPPHLPTGAMHQPHDCTWQLWSGGPDSLGSVVTCILSGTYCRVSFSKENKFPCVKFSDTKVTHEKSVSSLPSPTHLGPLLEHFLCMPPRNTLQGAFKLGTTNMWGWVRMGPADPGPLNIQYQQQHTPRL